ncbi:zinc finger and BTB domain-containing protein 32 [Rhynchocyon petersi]
MSLPSTRLPSPYSSDRLVRLAARLWPALCDTLISVGSQEFPAHSLVLAGVSQQLGHGGRWALVEGISPSTFAQLLHFVYGESVELQPKELGPLEEAARVLGVHALGEACKRAQEQQDPGLKTHPEELEKPSMDSERELGDLEEKQRQGFFRVERREQKPLHKHQEVPEVTRAMPEGNGNGEQMRSKEDKLNQSSVGCRGRDGIPGVVMWLRESPGGSEDCLWESSGSLPPAGSLQANIIPRPSWAEVSWLAEGQPAWQSILLLPPRYGTHFSHSPITGAWQEVWPRDQRTPLPQNLQKRLWSQNLLAPSTPTPGLTAIWESHNSKAGRQSGQLPSLPTPARARPYSCSVCGKRFALKHQMETHYRVHTGEKPFSCSLCPQRSRDFSAMTKHLRTHGAAPYRCPVCLAGCPSLASMQAHMRGHSPSQLPAGWTIRSTFLYSSSSKPSRGLDHV